MSLANRNYLRGVRKKAGLSQTELAFLLSISRAHLSKLEQRVHPVTTPVLVGYCLLLDCHPSDLFPDLAVDISKQAAVSAATLLSIQPPVITRPEAKRRESLEQIRLRCCDSPLSP